MFEISMRLVSLVFPFILSVYVNVSECKRLGNGVHYTYKKGCYRGFCGKLR